MCIYLYMEKGPASRVEMAVEQNGGFPGLRIGVLAFESLGFRV